MPQIPFHQPYPSICWWPPQQNTTRPSGAGLEDPTSAVTSSSQALHTGNKDHSEEAQRCRQIKCWARTEILWCSLCSLPLTSPLCSNASTPHANPTTSSAPYKFVTLNMNLIIFCVNRILVGSISIPVVNLWMDVIVDPNFMHAKCSTAPNQPSKKKIICSPLHPWLLPWRRLIKLQSVLSPDH